MAKFQAGLAFLICAQLAMAAIAIESDSGRIQRVESTLQEAIVLDEYTNEQFSLADRMKFYKTPGNRSFYHVTSNEAAERIMEERLKGSKTPRYRPGEMPLRPSIFVQTATSV